MREPGHDFLKVSIAELQGNEQVRILELTRRWPPDNICLDAESEFLEHSYLAFVTTRYPYER